MNPLKRFSYLQELAHYILKNFDLKYEKNSYE
jgi:hypothetical protein